MPTSQWRRVAAQWRRVAATPVARACAPGASSAAAAEASPRGRHRVATTAAKLPPTSAFSAATGTVGTARTRRRIVTTTAALALTSAFGTAAAAGAAAPAPTTPPTAQVTITVDTAHPFGALPADFVGLSFEMRELGVGNFEARTGNLVQLFRTLGPSNVRIGGNTLDRDTLWEPAGQPPPQPLPSWVKDVVGPADIARLNEFLEATRWRAEVGINVGHFDASLAADEAATLSSALGRRLVGAECGNEPNDWGSNGLRTPPYGYPQYLPDWQACAAVADGARLTGPDTSAPTKTGPWVTQFSQAEGSRLSLLTIHSYSVPGGSTAAQLLSPQTDASEVANVATELSAARAAKLPIRIDETNSASGGGILGVSDSYASALWAMDYSLLMAQDGFSGLNFHGGLGVCDAPLYNGKFQIYTPICAANAADAQAKIYTAAPEYYGLYLADRMGPGRFLPVTVSDASGATPNVTAYAVRGDDGRVRVAVIEKDDTTAAPVSIAVKIGGCAPVATVVHLTGTSLGSAQGVAIQGASVNREGRLPRRPGDLVRVDHGTVSLDIASGSAELITLL
jgi:hypothetical protein